MVVPMDAKGEKGIMEQPVTPRPCFNQPKLAVVEKARARPGASLSKSPTPNSNSSSKSTKSDPDSAPGTDPGAGAGLADVEVCHDPCERGHEGAARL